MFNENDNKNDSLTKEERKNLEQFFDFGDFSKDQDEVIKSNNAKKAHVNFKEFDDSVQNEKESKKRKGKGLLEHIDEKRAVENEEKRVQKTKTKRQKRTSKRKRKEIQDFEDIKKRRAYKFKRKKYTKVEDFIKYLNDHYLDLDEIADKVLTDENFHGWLKRRSKKFDESISDFRDIVEIIGN